MTDVSKSGPAGVDPLSAAAKRSPNATYETVRRPRYSQLQVRLATWEFILPKSKSDCVAIKIYILYQYFYVG